MAVYFNDLSTDERVALTLAQRDSGDVLDWRALDLDGPVIDKHSTGGVGDVVSLMLADGGRVRRLRADDLGAWAGHRRHARQAQRDSGLQRGARHGRVSPHGARCRRCDHRADRGLAPADMRIYAIRDGDRRVGRDDYRVDPVEEARGRGRLVMDVKVGSGAFMPTAEKSAELARSIVDVGNGAGMKTTAILTDMNQSLAPCAGNALEVVCAIDYLTGKSRPARLHEVTMALSAELLVTGGLARDVAEARAKLQHALDTGAAAERFARMVTALGGPADLIDAPARHLARAQVIVPVPSRTSGVVQRVDCRALGWRSSRSAAAARARRMRSTTVSPDGARGDRAACRGRRAARLRACPRRNRRRARWTRSSAATCWAKPAMRRRPFISRSADRSPVRAQATASLHVTGVSRRSGFGRADTSRTQSRV